MRLPLVVDSQGLQESVAPAAGRPGNPPALGFPLCLHLRAPDYSASASAPWLCLLPFFVSTSPGMLGAPPWTSSGAFASCVCTPLFSAGVSILGLCASILAMVPQQGLRLVHYQNLGTPQAPVSLERVLANSALPRGPQVTLHTIPCVSV